jgi:two-component system chemotaxis response regulator CheY
MKCLIVEDVDFVREMMVSYLADYAEIDTAVDGVAGLELFTRAIRENIPYDLVCLDIEMPNMDGQQALRQMRRIENEAASLAKKTIIIMTTALSGTKDITEALWEGDCSDYLVKPVNQEDLLAMLRKYGLINL